MIRERLIARIPQPRAYSVGVCADDIRRVEVCPELIVELCEGLRSTEKMDICLALFFAEQLLDKANFRCVAEPSLPALAGGIRAALAHPSEGVRVAATRACVVYHTCFEDFAPMMRKLLADADSQVRNEALAAAPTFLTPDDLALLLPFRDDLEVSETEGMGGPLRYLTRDLALTMAESIAGRQFATGDCCERVGDAQVSWRSWSAFTGWLDKAHGAR